MSTLNTILESSLRLWPSYTAFGFALVAGVLVARKSRTACILLICGGVLGILNLMWLHLCVAWIRYEANVNGKTTLVDGMTNTQFVRIGGTLLHSMGAMCLVVAPLVGRKKSKIAS